MMMATHIREKEEAEASYATELTEKNNVKFLRITILNSHMIVIV
jgi:hypothetical protein